MACHEIERHNIPLIGLAPLLGVNRISMVAIMVREVAASRYASRPRFSDFPVRDAGFSRFEVGIIGR
jgi:hypothetical protein